MTRSTTAPRLPTSPTTGWTTRRPTTTGPSPTTRAGNASIAATATAVTPDRTAPAAPAAPDGSGYPLHVTWADEAGTTFTLQRDGTAIAHTTQAAVTDADAVDNGRPDAPDGVAVSDLTRSGLTVHWTAPADHGTRYAYTVHGEDAAGNVGPDSAVGEFVARSGVAGYVVLVNGVATGPRATGTSLELTGLPIGVKRTITVVAVDGAGNGSDPSCGARGRQGRGARGAGRHRRPPRRPASSPS